MILTGKEIKARGIVQNADEEALQPTTYNATVGQIILEGEPLAADEYKLPPRGVVWVVSSEEFHLPDDVTGLATLKTTWTHDGILALNVGIVDPRWSGPLATALVNFSERPFKVRKRAQFLRVLFHAHEQSEPKPKSMSMEDYVPFICGKSERTSNTFLNIKALSGEVINEVFGIPRTVATLTKWGVIAAVAAALIGILAVFVPVAWDASKDIRRTEAQVEQLQADVTRLEEQSNHASAPVSSSPSTRPATGATAVSAKPPKQ